MNYKQSQNKIIIEKINLQMGYRKNLAMKLRGYVSALGLIFFAPVVGCVYLAGVAWEKLKLLRWGS